MKISLGGRLVGDGEPCLIVAEIGENPLGNVELACAHIQQAALVGADAVKFQTSTPEEIFNPSSPDYAEGARVELARSDYPRLMEVARANNVIFFSTPFDEPSADFLEKLGVPFFKIGSGELTHHSLLRHVALKGKPMIVSTGMSDQAHIDAAVRVIQGTGNDQLIIAHCVSIYPAPLESANVRALHTLQARLGVPVGYSDHTISNAASLAAVALGACYIEKHFTLSRALPEGDNNMSVEPHEFRALVHDIREVESTLGSGHRSVLPGEEILLPLIRRGIYARRTIRRGETIERGALAVRRPRGDIPADQLDIVVGRTATADIAPEEVLRWDHLADSGHTVP